MFIYLTEYFLLFFSGLVIAKSSCNERAKNKHLAIVFAIVLFLMLALRHQSIGIDLAYKSIYGYLGSFERIGGLSFKELVNLDGWQNYEPGFILYNWIVYQLCPESQLYLALTAALSLFPVVYIIHKFSRNVFLALIIYAALPSYMMLFSGLRQGLAISICVFSTVYIADKKLIKFLLAVFIASMFHYTAFIFAIAYPLWNAAFSQKTYRCLLLTLPLIYIFRTPLFVLFSFLFKDNAKIEETGAFMLMLLFMMLYAYMVFFGKQQKILHPSLNLFFVACCISIFSDLCNTANRVGYYFMPYLAICLPNMLCQINNKKERIIMYIIFTILFVYFALKSLSSTGVKGVSEYMFFWE